jgi:polygalacturonase
MTATHGREFDAADYGAGSNRTPEENRAAMRDATAEALKHGGGVVRLPEGIYEGLPPFFNNIRLVGAEPPAETRFNG